MNFQTSALETFNGQDMTVIGYDNEAWLTSFDIGTALEYSDPKESILNIYSRNKDELEPYSSTINLMVLDGKKRDTRVFNEEGVMLICMLSKQPRAAEFRRWAVGVLKAYRHGELSGQDTDKLHRQLISALRELRLQQDPVALGIIRSRVQTLCGQLGIPFPPAMPQDGVQLGLGV